MTFPSPLYLRHTVIRINGEKRVTSVTVAPVTPDRHPKVKLPVKTGAVLMTNLAGSNVNLVATKSMDPA